MTAASWAAQAVAEWFVVRDQAASHDEPFSVGQYLREFAQSTAENWQSEFLQLLTFVVLTVRGLWAP